VGKLGEVILDVFQVFRGGERPADPHSRPEHSFDAGVHFPFFDEFAAVSLLDTLSNPSSKARVVFQQPQRRILHEFRRGHAFLRGDSGEPCFFFGCESDFHDSSD